MTISKYLCLVAGEQPEKVARLHDSTVRRIRTFAMAIHIPVAIWALTSFLIASKIFGLDLGLSAAVSGFCSLMIYLVERLVLSTPKVWYVMVGRLVIGLVIAILGATAFDLIVFDREIASQLREVGTEKILKDQARAYAIQERQVAQKKADWQAALDKANCEANGTCGSKVRSTGPVFRQLALQAETMRGDFLAAQASLDETRRLQAERLAQWRNSSQAVDEAGLLERIEALHQYIERNPYALSAWMLLFVLVLSFELMVVLAKFVFTETVDDYLAGVRETLSRQQADDYLEALRSPTTRARYLLNMQA
jgi:hypothetical protein